MFRKLLSILPVLAAFCAPAFGFTNQYYIQNSSTFQGTGSTVNVDSETARNLISRSLTVSTQTAISIVVTTITPTGIVGTTTNNNAWIGNYGEYTSSANASNVTASATGVYDDFLSVSLTAGDWDVTGGITWSTAGLAVGTQFRVFIGTTSGNSLSGELPGNTAVTNVYATLPPVTVLFVPNVRFSLSSTTTVYLKRMSVYTSNTPRTEGGKISARRVR